MTKKTHLAREMSARHIQMIALGGVIGTGLFLSSGYTIHQAGPLGTVIAYLIGALIVYAVMLCLGELSVAMPYTGAFHVYAKNLIGPATGFTVAILYWLTWTIAMGSEFTAAGFPRFRFGGGACYLSLLSSYLTFLLSKHLRKANFGLR